MAYHANDMVRSLTQIIPDGESGTVQSKQEFSLDAFDRISVTKSSTAGVQLAESTNKYASGSDSPAWVESKTRPNASTAWDTTWTRNVSSLAGGLGMLQSSDGTARLQLADLRGNVVASNTIGSTGLDSYTSYTEYGTARPGVPDDFLGYGWLGAFSRKSAGNVGGLTLMGARLYNPTTGRFLARDSVAGGNDNAYVYPPDPINKFDLNGQFSFKNIVKTVVKIIKKVVAVAKKKAATISYYKRTEPRRAVAGKRPASSTKRTSSAKKKPAPNPKPNPKPPSTGAQLRAWEDEHPRSSAINCTETAVLTVFGGIGTAISGAGIFASGGTVTFPAIIGFEISLGTTTYGAGQFVKGCV